MPEYDFNKYGLRDYQSQSCEELWEKINNKNNIPLLLVMPTGTGKTRTAISFCLELLEHNVVENIIWVAHRVELIDQAKDTLKLCCYLKNGKTEDDYKADKERGQPISFDEDFVFSTSGCFKNELSKINDKSLVVYDEAHHCVSDNTTYCLDYVKKQKAKILGLTATPFRTNDDIPFVWEFTKRIGENEYNDVRTRAEYSIVEKITISAAIFKKYLCRFQIFGMKDLYRDLENEWKENKGNWSDYYNSKLEKTIISIISDNIIDNDCEIRQRPKGGKILIFSKQADRLYENLIDDDEIKEKGIGLLLSNHYKYRNPRSSSQWGERSTIISLYSKEDEEVEKNSLSVLINNAILTEGFDEPKVTDIILLYDTSSSIRMTQILGRGLRPYGDENRGCYVYNLANAEIVKKIYDGNEDISDLSDLDNLDVLLGELGEQIALTENDEILTDTRDNALDDGKNIKTVFPKNVIYDHIRASRLNSEFTLSGFLIADEIFQCFVSQQELDDLEKGEEDKIPSRFHRRFQDMLKDMLKCWDKVKNRERFQNSFVEYLKWRGKYKDMDDTEIENIHTIDKIIEKRISAIRKKVKEYGKKIAASIKEVFSEEGITPTPSDIQFYGDQVLLSVIGIGKKEG